MDLFSEDTARSCPSTPDEAPLQLAAVQLSHCVWGLHAWGPRGSDPTAGEVTAADPVPLPAAQTTIALAASPPANFCW